jgi:hypothetical protein
MSDAIVTTKPQAIEQRTEPADLLQAAIQSGASVDAIETLVGLKREMDQATAHRAYIAALALAKEELPAVFVKTKTVQAGQKRFKQAELGDILREVVPVLSKHRLVHAWQTHPSEGQVIITCSLSHEMGHVELVSLSSEPDRQGGKSETQAVASTVTALQRHTLKSILGIAEYDEGDPSTAQLNRLVSLAVDDRLTPEQREHIVRKLAEGISDKEASKWIVRGKKLVEEQTGKKYEPLPAPTTTTETATPSDCTTGPSSATTESTKPSQGQTSETNT